MQAPRVPAMFSLFKQRPSRGFDYRPRYYDPAEEARQERRDRLRAQGTSEGAARREELRERIRHSWQRQGSVRSSNLRLMVVLAMVSALAYTLYKGFVLIQLL